MLNTIYNNKSSLAAALLLAAPQVVLGEDQKRYSEAVVTQLVPSTANLGYTWQVTTQTSYDIDRGESKLRVTHYYTGKIFADDQIEFELAFRSKLDPFIQQQKVLKEDSATCKVIRGTTDTRFWSQSAVDANYTCADVACTGVTTKTTDTTPGDVDWTCPVVDDDPQDTFCGAPTAQEKFDGIECVSMRCVYERKLDTGDVKDFQFSPSAAADDEMQISPGRSMIRFAQASGTKTADTVAPPAGFATASTINIVIKTGALSGLSPTTCALTATAVLLSATTLLSF